MTLWSLLLLLAVAEVMAEGLEPQRRKEPQALVAKLWHCIIPCRTLS